ncbi:MAG: phosphoglycerate kinase [Chloroflexi bacterium]|nr:phosphoglycerate kinase [Chloroflexota bacterium]
MEKQTLRDIEVRQKRVLVRVDFNVPMEDGRISDDNKVRAVLPTLEYLLQQKARVVLCSHLGRPKGVDEKQRLAPIVQHLSQLLGRPVAYARDCVGAEAERAAAALGPGDVLLLENLRFRPEEEKNDPTFARALASLGEVFVNDAFGTAHRAHASTVGVTRYLPSVAGLLLERELRMLGQVLNNPRRPLAAVMGGAKVSDKIAVIENLFDKAEHLLIGGGMAATFLKAQGLEVGRSLVEEERLEFVRTVLKGAKEKGVDLSLPVDVVVAHEFKADAPSRTVEVAAAPPGWFIMDIGPHTIESFIRTLRRCRTVLWNGPMGVFEFPPFSRGTRAIAETLADLEGAVTVVGGGSTAEAVESLGLASRMTHVSTGGGASLEFLEGRELPGVAALLDKKQE